jgi:excisionase family DNA binding protein
VAGRVAALDQSLPMSTRNPAGASISAPAVDTATGVWTAGVGELQILTRRQAAKLLTVSVSTIRKWQRENRLPTTRLGTRVGVRAIDVAQFIRENTIVSSPTFARREGSVGIERLCEIALEERQEGWAISNGVSK